MSALNSVTNLHATLEAIRGLSSRAAAAAPANVQLAAGSLPPGTGQLLVVVAWVTGLVGLSLFVGFLVALGKTGIAALRHGQFEGGAGAVICLVCAVFLGAGAAIFGALGVSTG